MAGLEEEAFPEEVDTSTLEFLVCLSEECIDQMGQSQVDYAKVAIVTLVTMVTMQHC